MTITSNEFRAEVTSIAHSVLTDYNHDAINSIRGLQTELADLQNELATAYSVEAKEELQQAIADKETEIEEAIEALTLDDLDDVYDKVHEMVDDHEWVIYDSNAWDIAHLMSGDENACSEFEELVHFENGKSLDDLIQQFAFCALRANVSDEMGSALEEYKNELKRARI